MNAVSRRGDLRIGRRPWWTGLIAMISMIGAMLAGGMLIVSPVSAGPIAPSTSTGPPATAPDTVSLGDPAGRRIDLTLQGRLWVERGGARAPSPTGAEPPAIPDDQWQALTKRPSPGYTLDAYWLRWTLKHDGDLPIRYVLMLDPARIESVTLFHRRIDPGGQAGPWVRSRAGSDQPFSARPLPLRESAFPLPMQPGETHEVWLRSASRGSLALAPTLWISDALVAEQQWRVLRDGMLTAVGLTLAMLAAGLAWTLRDRGYGWIAAFLGGAMLYELSMRGTAFAMLWPDATDWAQRALGTTGALTTVCQLIALSTILRLRETQPAVHRALVAVIGLSLVAVAVCVFGDYALGTQMAAPTNLLLGAIGLIGSWRAMRRGDPFGGVWLFAIGGVLLAIAPRYLSLTGVLPHSGWADLAPSVVGTAGALAVLITMLRLLQLERRRHAQGLEQAVAARTAELARASAHAQASDAAKGRLLGHIGHDLRAPLASMVQLTRRLAPGRDFEAMRQAIEHGSLMLLDTVDELQRFAREPDADADLEVLSAPLYLHGLLHELKLQSQSLILASTNRMVLQADRDLPPVVELDARRLRQVLLNLLSNAAKYSHRGDIRLAARAEGDRLQLTVSDQGPGMSPEELARIFDPFMRGQAADGVPGLGLGLAIARQTVQAMGGELRAHSTPGMGSSFTVELPLVRSDEAQVRWPALSGQALDDIGRYWAAVVWDPCPAVREVLLERLLQCGFDALVAEHLEQLSELLAEASGPSVGLLLVTALEGGPTAERLLALRSFWPHLRILQCSTRGGQDWPVDARMLTLPKPAPSALWVPALRRLCPSVDLET